MNQFQISFSYNKNDYNATVKRLGGDAAFYFVSVQSPNMLKIKNPFVISTNPMDKKLEYSFGDEEPDLAHNIASAVAGYCNAQGIPLFHD